MKQSALILIDIQNDYFAGGKMALEQPETAAAEAARLLTTFRQLALPVFHIQHEMPTDARRPARFFLPGTPGQAIHASVQPYQGEPVITKHAPNAFAGTGLLTALRQRQITQLVICGMMTHMCVDSTARAAFDLGFQVTIPLDATATRTLSFGDTAVCANQVKLTVAAALHGVFARVTDTKTVLSQLNRDSAEG